MMSDTEQQVRFNEEARRYEVSLPGSDETAFLAVRRTPDSWTLRHTEVPSEFSGQGVGSALVRTALQDARAAGVTVKPVCPFIAAYIKRHQEEVNLVHPDYLSAVER